MRNLTFIPCLCLLASIATGQTYTATLTPAGQLAIADAAQEQPGPYDTLAVSFTLVGPNCTAAWNTGKLKQAPDYLLTLPVSYPTAPGFAVRKETYRGTITPQGEVKWQVAQSSECMALILPAPATNTTDTIYLQPISIQVPASTYAPDWQMPQASWGGITFVATTQQPDNAKVDAQWVISASGYIVDNWQNLSAGIYFAVTVWEWQGMVFVESDEFTVN